MIQTATLSENLSRAFEPTDRGVLGIVDELLAFCRDEPLQFEFVDGVCNIRSTETVSLESLEIPMRKAVFRAILARIAAMCNEREPQSVTPYGGQGIFQLGSDPQAIFHVSFANTPSEQCLELYFVENKPGRGQTGDFELPALESAANELHFDVGAGD